jgi:hypothetical protein
MAKAKGSTSGSTSGSSKGTKVIFSTQKGKSSIGKNPSSIKFSTMNKKKRASYKAYRGQGS